MDSSSILMFVKQNGPCLPRDVVKQLGGDTIIVGAILSQLVDNNQIKISNTKVGGSPVYYTQNQNEKLQNLYNYLNGMEKKAYDLLKQEKILRDTAIDPAVRVALRHIKDFAKGLEVNVNNSSEIFWKWYLLDNIEAEKIIRSMLGSILNNKTSHKDDTTKENSKEEEQKVQKIEKRELEKKEQVKKEPNEEQKTLQSNINPDDELLKKVHRIFKNKEIDIIEEKIIRKNSDIEYTIHVKTRIGIIRFFAKVKSKKKINDKDLSSAYVDGQMKKMPILFMTDGILTKKAEEKLDTEFKTITILKI